MSKNPAKDFGPIADDYAFFESHATQAEQDSRAYMERLAGIVPAEGTIRLLDFGCGSGTFTACFLQQASWPRALACDARRAGRIRAGPSGRTARRLH